MESGGPTHLFPHRGCWSACEGFAWAWGIPVLCRLWPGPFGTNLMSWEAGRLALHISLISKCLGESGETKHLPGPGILGPAPEKYVWDFAEHRPSLSPLPELMSRTAGSGLRCSPKLPDPHPFHLVWNSIMKFPPFSSQQKEQSSCPRYGISA